MDLGLGRSLQSLLRDFGKLFHFLSPLKGLRLATCLPKACALGCILTPLRGYPCCLAVDNEGSDLRSHTPEVTRLKPEVRRLTPELLPSYQRTSVNRFLARSGHGYSIANRAHPPPMLPRPGG